MFLGTLMNIFHFKYHCAHRTGLIKNVGHLFPGVEKFDFKQKQL